MNNFFRLGRRGTPLVPLLNRSSSNKPNRQPMGANRYCRSVDERCGAIIPLVAILLPILLVIAGFGLYIANAQLVRTELRTSVDFAARAGAKTLSMTQNQGEAEAAAKDLAVRNTVLGQPVNLSSGDILFGESRQRGGENSRFEFTPGGSRINSVQVNGTSEGISSVTDLFAKLSGVENRQFSLDSTATNLDRDICLVFDRSGSMTQPVSSTNNGTLEPCGPLRQDSRFVALSRAVAVFIAELEKTPQTEKVSVVSYSSDVNTPCFCCTITRCIPLPGGGEIEVVVNDCVPQKQRQCPIQRCSRGQGRLNHRIVMPEAQVHSTLSFNTGSLLAPFPSMIEFGIDGGTAIGSGLQLGLSTVEGSGARPFAFPTIVLMTDGNHNVGVDPTSVARQAAEKEIVIHTITFSAGANQALMKEVAGITGGKHLHADSAGDLGEAFREIAQTLPVMLTN